MQTAELLAEAPHQNWRLEDIDFTSLDVPAIQTDKPLLWLVAASSFIESATDVYSGNLAEYFSDDAEIASWLSARWQSEELQHGRALRRYVEHACPAFDWSTAFADFFAEYTADCGVEELGPTRAREMAARCVVETGTAALYGAIADAAPEPVLKRLAGLIRNDEVRHYKYFLRYMQRYRQREKTGRWSVAKTVLDHVLEIRNSDSDTALRHVYAGMAARGMHDDLPFAAFSQAVRVRISRRFPHEQATKMLFAPIELPAPLRRPVQVVVASAVRTFLLR